MNIKGDVEVKDLLPLGSVVSLKDAPVTVMITEYFVKRQSPNEKNIINSDLFEVRDYKGILWPEGDINPYFDITFNHEDIDTIFFTGYINEESVSFLNDIEEQFEKSKNEKVGQYE